MLKRYTLPVMAAIWDEQKKFETWVRVELAVLAARVGSGDLSQQAYDAIKGACRVDVRRIRELEEGFDQEMIAFITQIQESLEEGGAGPYKEEFHKYLTSYDVEDPALILLLREATGEVMAELERLMGTLSAKAREHQWTLMIARTHGQYAEPTTFGHLLLVFAGAMERAAARLETAKTGGALAEGKISGAVGNFAGMSPNSAMLALGQLGLRTAITETQILQRDRHADLVCALAITAGSMEQMARTFWEMMRSDCGELEESRKPKQRGSSAMAHKKNPILSERAQGIPRLLRGYAVAALENIATPECRDISQSSVEREILPSATTYVHYLAVKLTDLVERLVVFPDRMRENLERSNGTWASQVVRNALMEAGVSYETAYLYLQRCAFLATDENVSLHDVCMREPIGEGNCLSAASVIGIDRLHACFDPMTYIREGIEFMFERTKTHISSNAA